MLLVAVACLTICVGGCATSGNSCCDSGATGIFGQNRLFQNRPVRDAVQGWFQGDACNTCNPPVGMPANCGTNVAPMCNACGSSLPHSTVGNGVSLYDNSALNGGVLNAPIQNNTTTNYPNLVDPVINPGVEIGTPSGTVETGYGEIPMGPNF